MEKAIEEQIRDAEAVGESPVIIETDKELDVEMTPLELKSAGYVYIYDTRTCERSLCNRNMLPNALRKKRPDGSTVFTTVKPKTGPKRGYLKCMLHPDERKEIYDVWGLATCKKSNLTSPYQVKRHMMKRHKDEYASIKEEEARLEKEKERAEREQTRKFQESFIRQGNKEEPPLYVKEDKKKK